MSRFSAFRHDGKRALVVGGASGMGAAAAELAADAGAEVVAMDFAEITLPGARGIHVDLADAGSIDAALDECGGPVHALFSCAGVADGTPNIEKINFIGHRYLIEQLRSREMLGRGAAIGFISSAAGLGWEPNLPLLNEYLDISDFDAAAPLEQAYPLVFLCSDAAVAITGTTMITDSGYFSAGMTASFPNATFIVNLLLGREQIDGGAG